MASQAAAATLDITIAGIRNARGDIRVAVCSTDTFLKPTCEHVAHTPAQTGEVTLHIVVPPGTWAAQAFHDENRNGKIDTNILGIPTEGLGFSNAAPFRFGPPDFADAAFQLAPAGGRIRLSLRYF